MTNARTMNRWYIRDGLDAKIIEVSGGLSAKYGLQVYANLVYLDEENAVWKSHVQVHDGLGNLLFSEHVICDAFPTDEFLTKLMLLTGVS